MLERGDSALDARDLAVALARLLAAAWGLLAVVALSTGVTLALLGDDGTFTMPKLLRFVFALHALFVVAVPGTIAERVLAGRPEGWERGLLGGAVSGLAASALGVGFIGLITELWWVPSRAGDPLSLGPARQVVAYPWETIAAGAPLGLSVALLTFARLATPARWFAIIAAALGVSFLLMVTSAIAMAVLDPPRPLNPLYGAVGLGQFVWLFFLAITAIASAAVEQLERRWSPPA